MENRRSIPPRRRIRLPRSEYDGPGLVVMVTIGTRGRLPVFEHKDFASSCIDELRLTATENEVAILAYCFMPDHFHAVARLDGESNLIDVIRLFKGRTTRLATDYGLPRQFWQKSFYDHLVRPDEEPEKYVRYVIENPLRANLVAELDEYPFVGSFGYSYDSLEELLW